MKDITIEDIMRWDGSWRGYQAANYYSFERLKEIFEERKVLSAQEVGDLDIPYYDRLEMLVHMMPSEKERRLFACDCAQRALEYKRKKGQFVAGIFERAIKKARQFVKGEATSKELWDLKEGIWVVMRADKKMRGGVEAAAAATIKNDAAEDDKRAALDASRGAIDEMVHDEAMVRDHERQWQLNHAIEIINESDEE